MTIIQPNRRRGTTRFMIGVFFLLLFTGALGAVLLYNNVVDLRHRLADKEQALATLEVENAEFKNRTYALLDARKAKDMLEKSALIFDRNPEFIMVESGAIATNL
jgi:cell division protein FtsB